MATATGGIAPHISGRRGGRQGPTVDLAALPDGYRRELIEATVRQHKQHRKRRA